MHPIVRLEGAIQHYEWGSHTALAELRGEPTPSAAPEAELWLGTHPRGEAQVVTAPGESIALGAWIERDPAGVLGREVVARFGDRLPFLFKILAVERALSLQAHPNAEQARDGFAREQREGLGAADRVYVDPEAKPELVVAHTRFRVLAGFRPFAEIRGAFARLGLAEFAPPADDRADPWLPALLARWLAPGADAERDAALARALATARRDDPAEACLLELAEQHPNDPGMLAPLLLHAVELAPGEALFLEPGALHCHLGGVAAEIMSASDNVLRAGLTTKRRAVAELVRVGRFTPEAPRVLRGSDGAPGVHLWSTPAPSFELANIEVGRGGVAIEARRGVEILFCHAGGARVAPRAEGSALVLGRGQSCLIPADVGSYRLDGTGSFYRAGVPAARVPSEPIR